MNIVFVMITYNNKGLELMGVRSFRALWGICYTRSVWWQYGTRSTPQMKKLKGMGSAGRRGFSLSPKGGCHGNGLWKSD